MGTFRPHFERISYHVNVENEYDGQIRTEATVKIRIGDLSGTRWPKATARQCPRCRHAKALNGSFSNLAKLHLVDYKVRVINSDAATAPEYA